MIREIGKSGKKPFEFEATVRAAEKVRRPIAERDGPGLDTGPIASGRI